jgi:hypothetical protein
MTIHLVKMLSPKEAELLMEPTSQCRVRFRLGGNTFPPTVYYKIFTSNSNVHYFSGKRIIEFGSDADIQAISLMGNRTYYEAMRSMAFYLNPKHPDVSEHYEVTNRKEYIQVSGNE